ncbi:hypothetical protein [Neobacillus mesonae]|uniref:hypothetical protein n=1 Tax=Neobacillus mesonae TaxID=1193713 RepID=UPI0025724374|nr:hypothetical protein [Neobacillus mesonae]MED4205857.1 hypothetical protein [Neobacillus mesonae]
MHTIITGTNGAIYLGYPPPLFGPWGLPIHHHTVHFGHYDYHFIPVLYGHPSSFPYFGPYVPLQ